MTVPPLSNEAQALRDLLESVQAKPGPLSQSDSLLLRQSVMAVGKGGLRLPFLRVPEPGLSQIKLCPFSPSVAGKPFLLAAAASGLSLWDGLSLIHIS